MVSIRKDQMEKNNDMCNQRKGNLTQELSLGAQREICN